MNEGRRITHAPASLRKYRRAQSRGAKQAFLLSLVLIAGLAGMAAGDLFFSAGMGRAEAARASAQDGGSRASDPVTPEALSANAEAAPTGPRAQATGRVDVLVQLSDAPTAQVYAEVVGKSDLPRAQAEALGNRAA